MQPPVISIADRIHRTDGHIERFVAVPALLLLAFGSLYDVGIGNTGLGVLLIALVVVAPLHWRSLARDRLVWLVLAFSAWVLLSALLHARARPDWDYTIWNTAGDWLLTPLLGSLVVAFWLSRRPRLVPWLLALIVAGYLARIGEQASIEQIARLARGVDRATFGDAATNFGMWSLLVLLLLIALLPVALRPRSGGIRGLALAAWGVATVVAASGLLFSQTRSAWLAAVVTLPPALYLSLRGLYPGLRPARLVTTAGLVLLALAAFGWLAFGGLLEARLADNQQTIERILAGEVNHLPGDSPGWRLRMYEEALETWRQRPLLGHGPGASEIALAESDDSGIRQFKDFHNVYLVVLAEFGLTGLAVLGAFVVVLALRVRRAHAAGELPLSQVCLLGTSLLAFATTQLFEDALHSYRGPFVIALLGGLAWSCAFGGKASRERQYRP